MAKVYGLDTNYMDSDTKEDAEIETSRVEVGDNFVVVADELENGNPFYLILCNKLLHCCESTFNDEWGNT
jgi:hypothetical protein